jgi:Zn-finger nucleic acid-binding protein
MNVPDAGYCSACGGQLGLEPIGEAGALSCPLCKERLTLYRDPKGSLFDCGVCGGQFVDHGLLREMLSRHEHALGPDGGVKPSARLETRSSYIPCPGCSALMNRKNFAGMSGVIVDVCKKHGTWFDAGELPRVLAFVANGGLERSGQREAEEAARLRHEAAMSASGGPTPGWKTSSYSEDRAESVVTMFLHLLG